MARLRAECARLGIREVAVVTGGAGFGGAGYIARLAPLELKASQRVRLTRLVPKAVYKEDVGPARPASAPQRADPAADLVALLAELSPPVASAAP